ncbi:MAG: hypothetical protein OXT71_08865, partial [Acidobacteriota bacterium]|nr:hypothetical protein [Acidobacteriota bacterium]
HFFIDPCGKASAKMGKGEFQSVVRERAAWERTMAGLFFRAFSKIVPEWVSGGVSADYGFA